MIQGKFSNIFQSSAVDHNSFIIVAGIEHIKLRIFATTVHTQFVILADGRSAKDFILPIYTRFISIVVLQRIISPVTVEK
ncbi:hypothetical protein D3C81_1177880 [compost metagenome]